MTAKEAFKAIKDRTYVKWHDAAHDTFIYGKCIEVLKIFYGRHRQEIGESPRLITSARIRVSGNCTMTVELKDLYPGYVPDDMIRNYYDREIDRISHSQRSGIYIKCPRCGRQLDEDMTKNGESRRDGRVLVCPLCVKVERFCDDNNVPDPFTD